MRMRPPHTPCALGWALRERLTANRARVHASDGPSQPNYPGPDRVTAWNGVLSRVRGASRVFRVELEAKPCRSMVSGSLSTIG